VAGQVLEDSGSRFVRYVAGLTSVIGHADRAAPLRDYCVGLLAAEGRKSVEPLAAVTAPAKVSAQHQKLLHFVANAPWSDQRVLDKVREIVVPAITRHGPIEAWIIDDTSYPKQGTHSVGVQHQYCGQHGNGVTAGAYLTAKNGWSSLTIIHRPWVT
jgi:SRSO17 transposase